MVVTLQPHFTTASNGQRHLDGYAFSTTPADKITYIKEFEVDLLNTTRKFATVTNPNATSGSRTTLGGNYGLINAGWADVQFDIKDSAGNWCFTSVGV